MVTGMVIVNYNDYKTTMELIENVGKYNCIEEVVIVDNASTDNSYQILAEFSKEQKRTTVIKAEANKGYSAGLNIGSKYLIEKYKKCNIIVSNADIVIEKEDDVEKLLECINEEVVIVAPNILEKANKSRGWKIPSANQEILVNLPIIEKYILKKLKYNDSHYTGITSYVDTVSGCFFVINSSYLKKMEYFDENVFLYYEENIMGAKTRRLNKKIAIANNVNVIHNHSVTIDKSIKRINKVDIQKKSQYYFEKEYNKANGIQLFFMRFTRGFGRILLKIKYMVN